MKTQLTRIKAGLSLPPLLAVTLASVFFQSPAFAAPVVQGEARQAATVIPCSAEGFALSQSGQPAAALPMFEEALARSWESGDRAQQALCLLFVGDAKVNLSDNSGALEALQASLPMLQEIGDRPYEALALYDIGLAHERQGQYLKALDSYQKALETQPGTGYEKTQGIIANRIGAVYISLGQYDNALDALQRALDLRQKAQDRRGEGVTRNDIGEANRHMGQYTEALRYYQQALTIAQETQSQTLEGTARNNMGLTYSAVGEYRMALNALQKAYNIRKTIGNQADIGDTLNNFGLVYHEMGDYKGALGYFQQAQDAYNQAGTRDKEEVALGNIGSAHDSLGEYADALKAFADALEIENDLGIPEGQGTTLNNIGLVYDHMDDLPQAQDNYQRALDIRKQIGDRAGEAATLSNLGGINNRLGQYPQARDYLQQALAIAQDIGDRALQANTLGKIGYVYQQQHDTAQAILKYQQAVDITEALAGKIQVEEFKASFITASENSYGPLIGLLWDQGSYQDAFNYAERARARAFLDELAGGQVDFRAGVDADLLKQEEAQRSEIDARRSQVIMLRNRPQNEWDTAAIAAAQDDLNKSEDAYAQLLKDIKTQSPEAAGLVSVRADSLAAVQALLDKDTTLLEYFVTPDRTLAFVITHGTFETVALDISQADLTKTITSFREFASLADARPASLKQLYAWLIAPLKGKLKTSVVGIIPHGVLHYLPFAALTDGARYLSDDYSLFTLPSASVLRFIQAKRKPALNTMLALAEPTAAEPGLVNLQFAKQEVETAAGLFGAHPLEEDAASESALRSQASGASIIHLAAHGEYNAANPLFSVIYLAPDKQNDGRLEVNEIYSLDLTKATDLVVLSACQTDVGAVSNGDEVVGMTRAFLYAGTPTVIASLWNVDDEATQLLMDRFYRHLREGKSKAEALQEAQRDVRATHPNPYYWAAFVLTGDPGVDSPSALQALASLPQVGYLAAGIVGCIALVATLVIVLIRRRRVQRRRIPT